MTQYEIVQILTEDQSKIQRNKIEAETILDTILIKFKKFQR